MKISSKNIERLLTIFDNYHGQNDKVLNCFPQDSLDDVVIELLSIINELIKEDKFINNKNAVYNMLRYVGEKLKNPSDIDRVRVDRKITKILESINTTLLEERYYDSKKKEYRTAYYHLSRSIMKLPVEENENTKYLEVLWTIITEVENIDYLNKSFEILNVDNTVFRDSHTLIMELVSLYVEKISNLVFDYNFEEIRYYNQVIKLILFNKFWNVTEVEKEWCIHLLSQEIEMLNKDDRNFLKVDFLDDILHSFNTSFDSSKILYDLSLRYNVNVENSSLCVPSCDIDKRFTKRVISNDYIISIDSSDTKEIDDCISCEKLEDGTYLLGIHIADIFGYIKSSDAIIEEALSRGETLYLEDLLIYMLPKEFSCDKASLLENKPRYADSHYFVINKEGKIISDVMMKTIITNRKKTTYDEVNKILDKNKKEDTLFNLTLRNLKEVEKVLENKIFSSYRNEDSKIKKSSIANRIVTYIMMLENVSMAEYFYERNLPFIYRVCEDKANDEFKNIVVDDKIALEMDKIIYELKQEKGKVVYGCDGSHSELGFAHYSHSTSPLRRFADLWNRYLNTVFRNKEISDEKVGYLRGETNRIISTLNEILDNASYFTIEYNKKIKQLK